MAAITRISLPCHSLAEQLFVACALECTVRKPGNVHPQAAFEDVTYADFIRSAEVVAPVLARSAQLGVGLAIRDAVIATQDAVGTNTNLGMLLLLAPLAAIPSGTRCAAGIDAVLQGLDQQQTNHYYEAIRLAEPGGLGQAAEHDVSQPPTISILEAMQLAPYDRVAWQYGNSFADVLKFGRQRFLHWTQLGQNWEMALIRVQLEFLARQSDSLILRKCGQEIANEAQQRAQEVLLKWEQERTAPAELQGYDHWLRKAGHRRNPGTTADLLAAMLFALIRDEEWTPPDVIDITGE